MRDAGCILAGRVRLLASYDKYCINNLTHGTIDGNVQEKTFIQYHCIVAFPAVCTLDSVLLLPQASAIVDLQLHSFEKATHSA